MKKMAKNAGITLLVIFCLFAGAGCKKEFNRLEGRGFTVSMPGKPEQSYIEFPFEELESTLPMHTYESQVGDEYFVVTKVEWADVIAKYKEQQGESFNGELFYTTMSNAFFSTMVSTGNAGGTFENVTVSDMEAYRYSVTAYEDPQTGESLIKDAGRGYMYMVPTENALYMLVYYASNSRYDETRMNVMLDSFVVGS
jgi:hypothetical protein